MSKEYIEREIVIEKCNKLLDNADSCPNPYVLEGVQLVRDLILIDEETRVPAADVAPVVHGKWIPIVSYFHGKPDGRYYCSECRRVVNKLDNFCLSCGADMRGEYKNV